MILLKRKFTRYNDAKKVKEVYFKEKRKEYFALKRD